MKVQIVEPGRFNIAWAVGFWFACLALVPLCVTAQIVMAPRERISLNADWRFQKGDPPGTEGQLAYEKIKALFKATGNEFAANAEPMKLVWPEGKIPDDVPYLRRSIACAGTRSGTSPVSCESSHTKRASSGPGQIKLTAQSDKLTTAELRIASVR